MKQKKRQKVLETIHLSECARVGIVEVVEGLVEPEVGRHRLTEHALESGWGRYQASFGTTAKKPRRPCLRQAHSARKH